MGARPCAEGSEMKERPILFKGEMVRAILAGRKTQTRRIVKPHKDRDIGCQLARCELAGEVNAGEYRNAYCAPGDRLWVREGHAFSVVDPEGLDWHDDPSNWDVIYRADPKQPGGGWRDSDGNVIEAPWRPSIHMPRWASRITLEVTGVRAERLQDISEADCQAEGIEFYALNGNPSVTGGLYLPAAYYRYLWESINGAGSWDANPWVWVVEFKVAK
jgi:hypothetical protein